MPKLLDTNETTPQRAYFLKGITYLPHYRIPNLFVAPGSVGFFGKTLSKAELLDAGAVKVTELLWPRPIKHKTATAKG